MTPEKAYKFALTYIDFDIGEYQEISCRDPFFAMRFAIFVTGANIEYCQKHACKDHYYAYRFAKNVPESDIEYCYRFSKEFREDVKNFVLNEL